MFISSDELNRKKPNIEGARTNIYYLNSEILAKRFKNMADRELSMMFKKYNYSKKISDLKGVSLPIDILETEKGFSGYIEKIIPEILNGKMVSFADYVNSHRFTITLDDITSYMLKVCDIVSACHKTDNNIVNPDLASEGNVWFNQKTKEVCFTDYQDMQVGDIPSQACSSFIVSDPIINTPKYHKKGLYTPNIDLYTLAIRYFYYATKINVPRTMFYKINIEDMLKETGISDTSFANCMRVLYDKHKDNMDIREAIIELNENYKISRFKQGQPRVFIRK